MARIRANSPRFTSVSGTFYRFHKAKYFTHDASDLFCNFSFSRGLFEAQGRFAPAHGQCGFFFAARADTALAEMLYYAGIREWSSVSRMTPADALGLIRTSEPECDELVFLETDFSLDGIADLTEWTTVRDLLEGGTLRRRRRFEYQVDYLAQLLSRSRGGTNLTDVLGLDVAAVGGKGLKFPSVRAALYDGPLPPRCALRQNLDTLLPRDDVSGKEHLMSAAGNIMDLMDQAYHQLRSEWNLVVLDDNALIRSIRRIHWLDEKGSTGLLENPFYGASDDHLELVRLRKRAHTGVDPVTAAQQGLMTALEREQEFFDEGLYIRA